MRERETDENNEIANNEEEDNHRIWLLEKIKNKKTKNQRRGEKQN